MHLKAFWVLKTGILYHGIRWISSALRVVSFVQANPLPPIPFHRFPHFFSDFRTAWTFGRCTPRCPPPRLPIPSRGHLVTLGLHGPRGGFQLLGVVQHVGHIRVIPQRTPQALDRLPHLAVVHMPADRQRTDHHIPRLQAFRQCRASSGRAGPPPRDAAPRRPPSDRAAHPLHPGGIYNRGSPQNERHAPHQRGCRLILQAPLADGLLSRGKAPLEVEHLRERAGFRLAREFRRPPSRSPPGTPAAPVRGSNRPRKGRRHPGEGKCKSIACDILNHRLIFQCKCCTL